MKKGFTLSELLVIMAIIGILASVITAGVGNSKAKSRDAVRIGDLKSLSLAAQSYFQENNGAFPNSISDLNSYFVYNAVPTDPKDDTNYFYTKLEHGYCLGATMETSISANEPVCAGTGIGGTYIIKGP